MKLPLSRLLAVHSFLIPVHLFPNSKRLIRKIDTSFTSPSRVRRVSGRWLSKPFRNLVKGWEKAAQQGDEQVKAEDYIYIIEIQGHEGKTVHSWEMGISLRRLGLRENGGVQIIPK